MKYSKYLAIAMLVCFGTLTLQQVAKADLTVAETVAQFNGLNSDGKGASFTFSSNSYSEHQLTATNGNFSSFLGAYKSSSPVTRGYNYFNTFCVESNEFIDKNTSYRGTLSYEEDGTTKSTSGYVLSLGGAYLYQQFATGALDGYFNNRSSMVTQLQNAIHFLTIPSQETTNWNNKFLQQLLNVNLDSVGIYTDAEKKAYWTSAYNLDHIYAELGNNFSEYAVFVLQVTPANGDVVVQDQLLVTKVSRPSTDTPEPATMLLWLTGGLSALGFGYAKKRRKMTSLA